MVVSSINKKVSYAENKTLDEKDADSTTTLYITEIHDQNCLIALGKVNKKYEEHDIFYIPIYLVDGVNVISKVGVFEMNVDNEPTIYDAERDYDLEQFNEPLLFSFITKEFIIEKTASVDIAEIEKDVSVVDEEDDEGDEVVSSMEKQEMEKKSGKFPFQDDTETLVDVQTEHEAKKEVQDFDESTAENWLQKFMRNGNYSIQTVPGNGDCFFSVIKESFVGIPMDITVKELRNILSNHADEATLSTRIERFKMFKTEKNKANIVLKEAKKKYASEQKRLSDAYEKFKKLASDKSKPLQERTENSAKSKAAKTEWKRIKVGLKVEREKKEELFKIADDDFKAYRIMDGVNTMGQFVDVIKNSNFWADEWAIKKFEGLLNVKFIILSEEKFKEGEVEGVLQCGGEVSEVIRKKGVFKPAYYILTSFKGNHYDLITYKDRRVFKYNEIPLDVKNLIKEKCMETSTQSEWNYISKFKELTEGVKSEKVSVEEDEDNKKEPEKDESLYNDEVVFQFYSKSADKPKPGKGNGESIKQGRESDFSELGLKENNGWRKVLSNFYISPFQIDGKRWNSVEHYFHANKFKTKDSEYYLKFSLDHPDSAFKEDPALAKKAGRKLKLNNEEKQHWERVKSGVMKKAQLEKYRTDPNARKTLLLTKDAKLMHYLGRGQGVVEFTETMEIRRDLRNKE